MTIVLDTCALLWLTLDPTSLTTKAHRAIASSNELLVSSISVWEIGIKVSRGHLSLGTGFESYVERLGRSDEIELVPVDHNLWARSVSLDWLHRDPADRVIVSLALERDALLITGDNAIREFYRNSLE